MSGGEWLDKPTVGGWWWFFGDELHSVRVSQLGYTYFHGSRSEKTSTLVGKWQRIPEPVLPPPPLPKSRNVEMTARVSNTGVYRTGHYTLEIFADGEKFRMESFIAKDFAIDMCRGFGIEPEIVDVSE